MDDVKPVPGAPDDRSDSTPGTGAPRPGPALGNERERRLQRERLSPETARLLEFTEENCRRLIRRISRHRRVRADGPIRQCEWANERDIDLRIDSGDPVGIIDAFHDLADAVGYGARAMEVELGIDTPRPIAIDIEHDDDE
jgi:hypothetical protein